MHYLGGSLVMSYIDRDLISLPEINGHLKDHGVVSGEVLLHWLYPGKNLDDGLRLLHDDKVCQEMAGYVTGMEVADVFVESMAMQLEALADDERSYGEANDIAAEMGERAIVDVNSGSSSEVEFICERKSTAIQATNIKMEDSCLIIGEESSSKMVEEDKETDSTSESDYLPSGFCSSEEEEAIDINNKFIEFKKKTKSGEVKSLDDVIYSSVPINQPNQIFELEGCELVDGNCTPYDNSSDEDESFEEGSDGEIARKEDQFPRQKRNAPTRGSRLALSVLQRQKRNALM